MKEKNDMRTMQQQEQEFNERQLSLRLPAVCRSLGYLCQTTETLAGGALTSFDKAHWRIKEKCNLAGGEGLGVKA